MKTHYYKMGITPTAIKNAEKVLADNGIEQDEVQTVLQAIGYVLLDCELYPAEIHPESEKTDEVTGEFKDLVLTGKGDYNARHYRKTCEEPNPHTEEGV